MASTTTPTVPADLLQAVNELLRAIRLSGVMSLNAADLNEAASSAKQALDQASLEIQLKGWYFNRSQEAIIDPTPSGEIVLPSNTLRVRKARCSSGTKLVFRGGKLWDPKKRTFVIGESVEVDMVEALEFADLSASFRKWVTALAARRFCIPRLPSNSTFAYTEEFLSAAVAEAELEDAEVNDEDLTYTSPHFAKHARK